MQPAAREFPVFAVRNRDLTQTLQFGMKRIETWEAPEVLHPIPERISTTEITATPGPDCSPLPAEVIKFRGIRTTDLQGQRIYAVLQVTEATIIQQAELRTRRTEVAVAAEPHHPEITGAAVVAITAHHPAVTLTAEAADPLAAVAQEAAAAEEADLPEVVPVAVEVINSIILSI
jgi:hypothetical protein